MINSIEKKLVKVLYNNIVTKYEFPKFGSPETKCSKCMFHNIACYPAPAYVGCYHGWKREEE